MPKGDDSATKATFVVFILVGFVLGAVPGYLQGTASCPEPKVLYKVASPECASEAGKARDKCMNSGLSGLRKNPKTISACEKVYESDLARCSR